MTELKAGMRVRPIHDPQRVGVLTGKKEFKRGRRQMQVQFRNGPEFQYEEQLELVPDEESIFDLIKQGKFGKPQDIRRTLTHVRLTGRLADIIYSMEATNTDFHPYQFKPVLKMLRAPTNSLLIADEVGLGKTIEAGLIWTELRSRYNLHRLVVLCPAALCGKWKDELANKFGVSSDICDARETLRILRNEKARASGFAIVASMQGLRSVRDRDGKNNRPAAAQLEQFLADEAGEDPLIDLLVIDEAHHMRNPESRNNLLGRRMRNVSHYVALLTATPIHNYSQDLFSLLRFLDPDTFSRSDDFENILDANKPLVRARDMVLKNSTTIDDLKSVLMEAKSNPLLRDNQQINALLSIIEDKVLDSPSERSRIAHRLENVNLWSHSFTRTRKRDVQEWRVVRDPSSYFIEMNDVERKFYNVVTDIVIDYSQNHDINRTFLLVTPQRQMVSCMPAALRYWKKQRSIEVPEYESAETNQDEQRTKEIGPLVQELVNYSDEFVFDELIKNDSKYKKLREVLKDFFKQHPKDKVIVFSEFRATLEYLSERLKKDGISNIVLHGGVGRNKDDIIQEFRSPKGPNVMLSSEVGGEGVDLQFSWVIINYDLPWNPMRVEQRIGRVDRLGQSSEKVLIWNLFYEDTIDSRIYNCLYDKLELCQHALGDFEAILGEKIMELQRDIFTRRLSPEQQEDRIKQTAQALETLKQEEERLESEATHLVAHGDYIRQQVQAARDENRWINGGDLSAYVIDFLNVHYPGCKFRIIDKRNYEYEISLTPKIKFELGEFVSQHNLIGQTRLIRNLSKPVVCRFQSKMFAMEDARKEIISHFHPLIHFINDRISETLTRGPVSVKVSVRDVGANITPGIYVVAISLWSIQGIHNIEKLVYEAASLEKPETVLEEDQAERLANVCASMGELWLETRNACDLDRVHEIAYEYLSGNIDERYEQYIEEVRAENADRADIQEKISERDFLQDCETIRGVIDRLRQAGNMGTIPAWEGRLKARKERYEMQKHKIESQRNMTSRAQEISALVVLVE